MTKQKSNLPANPSHAREAARQEARNVAFWDQTKKKALTEFPADGDVREIELFNLEGGELANFEVSFGQTKPRTTPWFTSEELKLGVYLKLGEHRLIATSVGDGDFHVHDCIDLQSGEDRQLAITWALHGLFKPEHVGLNFYVRELDSIDLKGGKKLRDYDVRPITLTLKS